MRKLRPKNKEASLTGLFFDNGSGSELKLVTSSLKQQDDVGDGANG